MQRRLETTLSWVNTFTALVHDLESHLTSHVQQLINAEHKGGGRPNNDALYPVAFLNLSQEPNEERR